MKTKEEIAKYAREYYWKNRDKIRARQNAALKPGSSTEAVRRWRAAHPEQSKELARKNREDYIKSRRYDANRLKTYGITLEQYDNMLTAQKGMCAIAGCGIKEGQEGAGHGNRLHVDHDHKTKIVRGLLCSNHNTALGKFNDSIEQLQSAIDYLLKNKN
jgi:hypothetical protein